MVKLTRNSQATLSPEWNRTWIVDGIEHVVLFPVNQSSDCSLSKKDFTLFGRGIRECLKLGWFLRWTLSLHFVRSLCQFFSISCIRCRYCMRMVAVAFKVLWIYKQRKHKLTFQEVSWKFVCLEYIWCELFLFPQLLT